MILGLPFYPDKSFSDGIWDVPFYLAFCAELFETYRILHRVGKLYVVLRFQILVCRYWGFIVCVEALFDMCFRMLEVDGLRHAKQSMMVTIRPG